MLRGKKDNDLQHQLLLQTKDLSILAWGPQSCSIYTRETRKTHGQIKTNMKSYAISEE